MNVILGATGQIGSMVVAQLLAKGHPVRAVVRNEYKAQMLKQQGAEIAVADYFGVPALTHALSDAVSIFLITPEDPGWNNYLSTVKLLLRNYREAIANSTITKIVALSSLGAQHPAGTGNLVASNLLENNFKDLAVKQVFIRPAYYYSNWLGYVNIVKSAGVLPTFFSPSMKIEMIAPQNVAQFAAEALIDSGQADGIQEISGPQPYSSTEIAEIFAEILQQDVALQQIFPDKWETTLLQAGFTGDFAQNVISMTQAVIDGKTKAEFPMLTRLPMNFRQYAMNLR